ncbi:IclR family transcriptional regulator [Desulfosarcina sp.]|uniref:IclR family transcriptional regulator n=1 Tax=Desulfosarcina sp. TaxID=2027861 RepID=UPI003566A208
MVVGAFICNGILIMAAAESEDPLKISASPGTTLPLFAGAAGKVFLAEKTNDAVKMLIREKGLPQHTTRSIVNENEYLLELERIRSSGHAIDDEEYLVGVKAVAVALENIIGPPMAIWAVGLSSSMGAEKIQDAIDRMTTAKEKLQKTMNNTFGY